MTKALVWMLHDAGAEASNQFHSAEAEQRSV